MVVVIVDDDEEWEIMRIGAGGFLNKDLSLAGIACVLVQSSHFYFPLTSMLASFLVPASVPKFGG